jgi:Invasin, domain 3
LTQSAGPATSVTVQLSPSSIVANGTSTATATATVDDAEGHPVEGDHLSFSSSDNGVHFGVVTDHGNGTYSATLTSSTTAGSPTITATDSTAPPSITGSATLIQTPGPIGPTTTPQGNWVGTYGSSGYDLLAWNQGVDLMSMPGVTVTNLRGLPVDLAYGTTDPRALESSSTTTRSTATDFDFNELQAQLTFSSAFTGKLSLYAVDWLNLGSRETITVGTQSISLSSNYSQGAWVTFPITVPAGGSVTITITRTAGVGAYLSGIFLN